MNFYLPDKPNQNLSSKSAELLLMYMLIWLKEVFLELI